jgi:hypothetical protein
MLAGDQVVPDTACPTPTPRDPELSAAIKYRVVLSSANAIAVVRGNGAGAKIVVGPKIQPAAVMAFWLPAEKARSIATRARGIAGTGADVADVVTALRQAAAEVRATLTPSTSAIPRAYAASLKLDAARDRDIAGLQSGLSSVSIRRKAMPLRGHALLDGVGQITESAGAGVGEWRQHRRRAARLKAALRTGGPTLMFGGCTVARDLARRGELAQECFKKPPRQRLLLRCLRWRRRRHGRGLHNLNRL